MRVIDVYRALKQLRREGHGDKELKVVVSPEDIRPILQIDEWFSNQAAWIKVRLDDPGGYSCIDRLKGQRFRTVSDAIEEMYGLVSPDDGDYGDSGCYVLVGAHDVRGIEKVNQHGIHVVGEKLDRPKRKISEMIAQLGPLKGTP